MYLHRLTFVFSNIVQVKPCIPDLKLVKVKEIFFELLFLVDI